MLQNSGDIGMRGAKRFLSNRQGVFEVQLGLSRIAKRVDDYSKTLEDLRIMSAERFLAESDRPFVERPGLRALAL
jgi:hypothetical protein